MFVFPNNAVRQSCVDYKTGRLISVQFSIVSFSYSLSNSHYVQTRHGDPLVSGTSRECLNIYAWASRGPLLVARCFTFSDCHRTLAAINRGDTDPWVKHFEATKGPDGITRRDPNYFCVIAEQYFPPKAFLPLLMPWPFPLHMQMIICILH